MFMINMNRQKKLLPSLFKLQERARYPSGAMCFFLAICLFGCFFGVVLWVLFLMLLFVFFGFSMFLWTFMNPIFLEVLDLIDLLSK